MLAKPSSALVGNAVGRRELLRAARRRRGRRASCRRSGTARDARAGPSLRSSSEGLAGMRRRLQPPARASRRQRRGARLRFTHVPAHAVGVVLADDPLPYPAAPGLVRRASRTRSATRAACSAPSTSCGSTRTASCATSPSRRSTPTHGAAIVEAVRALAGHRGAERLGPHLPAAPRRQDRGRAEGADQEPRRPLDGLHARRRTRLHGDPRRSLRRLEPDRQGQHRRRRHRRHRGARAGRHRPRGGDAGHGGQGDAVQGVRRRRRLADLPGHARTSTRSSPS